MLLDQKQIDLYWLKGLTSAVDYLESHATDGGLFDEEIRNGMISARERLIQILARCKGRMLNSSNPGITLMTVLDGIITALELRPDSIAHGFGKFEEASIATQIDRLTTLLK